MQHTDHTPTTTLPCPPWCTLPPGHGFDMEEPCDPTLLHRWHTRTIAGRNDPR
jgi:hypothetical protein